MQRFAWILVWLVIVGLTASDATASCPFFNGEPVERSDAMGVPSVRLNAYAAGSQVCHGRRMWLCRSAGTWKDMGDCRSYLDWESRLTCRFEGGTCESSHRDGQPGSDGRGPGSSGGWKDLFDAAESRASQRRQVDSNGLVSAPPPAGMADPPGGPPGSVETSPSSLDPRGGGSGPGPSPSSASITGRSEAGAPGADGASGACHQEEKRLVQRLSRKHGRSICGMARESGRLARELDAFYRRCPSGDPGGEMRRYVRELNDWARETGSKTCN